MDFNSPENVHGERQTLYCVPIPGESDWVKQTECFWSGQNGDTLSGNGCQSPPRTAAKRSLDEDDHDKMETDDEIDKGEAGACRRRKYTLGVCGYGCCVVFCCQGKPLPQRR